MDYNARYYSPYLNRFISPDTIVPEPGSSGGFNRYRYTRNNPLRYVDPSGFAGCAADDQACWDSRWYRAHGYQQDSKGNWALSGGNAQFADPEILNDVLAENGISLRGGDKWNFGDLSLIGQGVVALSNKIGGSDVLDTLLGSSMVTFAREAAPSMLTSWCSIQACTIGSTVTFYDALFTNLKSTPDLIRGVSVHELAHIIDYASFGNHVLYNQHGAALVKTGSYSSFFPQTTDVSDYAQNGRFQAQEYFAEALTIAVYGPRYNVKGRTDLDGTQTHWFLYQLGLMK